MRKVLGLVLIGTTEVPTTIAPERISLLGKPAIDHVFRALREVCEEVVVEEGKHAREGEVEILRRALTKVAMGSDDKELAEVKLIVHDSQRPLVTVRHLRELREALAQDATPAATTSRIEGVIVSQMDICRQARLVESPVGFDLQPLLHGGIRPEDDSSSLCELAVKVARRRGRALKLISRQYASGRLLSSIKTDEVEALLRANFGLRIDTARLDISRPTKVLVLGGTGGIGRACIELVGRNGIDCSAPPRAVLDLRVEREFRQLAEVDAVINAAGAYGTSATEIMDVNFHGCMRLLDAIEAAKWCGRVVFLSSTAATFGRRGAPAYSASKAALNSLIEARAEALGGKGVFISAVAPAKVNTRLQEKLNPGTLPEEMIEPGYIAAIVMEELTSSSYGHIRYIRKGEDVDTPP